MQLSYAHGASNVPLIGNTIGDQLDLIAAEFASKEALVSVLEKKRYTYSEFLNEVNLCARALLSIGVRKGDRIGIWSTNCVAWTILQFATAKMGAILVNINPAYRLHELEYALQQSQCKFLVSGEKFKDCDYVKMIVELMPELQSSNSLIATPSPKFPEMKGVIVLSDSCSVKGMMTWADMMKKSSDTKESELKDIQASLDFDDIINIQYTSGTTGFPKGAMLTHRGILNNGYWVGARMNFSHRDRLCIPVPFYHCFGMVLGNLTCVSHGATMVIPGPHFSPLSTLQAIESEKCTAVHGVPTMFIAELEHPDFKKFDLSSLRTGVMAGAPCPIEVMKRVNTEMHCPEITIACGMTEASPVCNQTEVNDPIELRVGTVGKIMPHQEQKIIDPATGRILPRGEQGELCYRGYQIMKGYYRNPEGTKDAIDENGWMHSGDLAVMNPNGYVKITGRLKDMIIRGGENIYPREIEEFLFTNSKVAEAYVIGVPDKHYGEQVMVWVKTKEGSSMTADEVRQFCKGQIMDYKIPKYVKIVNEFPTTVTGKIQKFKMREISVKELGLEELLKLKTA